MTTAGVVWFDADAGGVATITLDRADRLNAIDLAMRDLLWSYIEAIRELGEAVRVVVFKGAGPSFCAGADIQDFGTAPSLMAARRGRLDRDLWGELLRLPAPTIAQLHGHCYGAGLELPLCCDRRIAAEGSLFALPETRLGYMPSAGGTQTLPRVASPGVAAHMVLSGEPIDAGTALRWGVVDAVVPAQLLGEAVAGEVARATADPAGTMARRRALFEARQ